MNWFGRSIVIVGMTILAIGCGGSSSSDGGSFGAYPAEVRTNFLDSCVLNSGASTDAEMSQAQDICECTLGKIEKEFSLSEFNEAEQALMAGRASGIDMTSIVQSCM